MKEKIKSKLKIGLLVKIIIAILLGLLLGRFMPEPAVRVFMTFNGLFSNLLRFCIPLIILGLVAPGIADMGKNAGRLLVFVVVLSYGFTMLSGFFTYFSCSAVYPYLLSASDMANVNLEEQGAKLAASFFEIKMPPVFDVMTALILAFILGIGIALQKGEALKSVLIEFRSIVEKLISGVIIPLLPFFIFGIFLNMSFSGEAFEVISLFGKVIAVIFTLHILLLLMMFFIAGIVAKRNPFKMLYTMLPAYLTALGTSSSAATIPVTLSQVKKIGVNEDIADFSVPLCATIHLSGSTLKVVAMSLAVCFMEGLPHDVLLYTGFIMMLGIVMIAAPGVPGGAIMASVGILQSMLHFSDNAIGLIIAVYLAIDSFGTACNVTGDGAVAVIVDKFARKEKDISNKSKLLTEI